MKTIIAGSRGCNSFSTVCDAISQSGFGDEITEIVSGGALGVDQLGEKFAHKFDIPMKQFLADWKQYDKAAGMIRNREMAEYSQALIAVYDGSSKGTANMIEEAKKRNLKVYVHLYTHKENLKSDI
jgi:3-keto-L-gulonate-6-phosphate decarboxylase